MLQSMTGYGQAQSESESLQINVEMKALNSRNFDLNLRLPKDFSHKEPELRNYLNKELKRGKITFFLELQHLNPQQLKQNINHDLIRLYHKELSSLCWELDLEKEGLLRTLLNMPSVLEQPKEENTESEWELIFPVIQKTVEEVKQFRQYEGGQLKEKLKALGNNIKKVKQEIKDKKDQPINKKRKKLEETVKNFNGATDKQWEENRFEQEMIYYIEKMDITEELDRLDSHLQYFFQTLDEEEAGRRLNFIAQEIGREINTIGSKINDAEIQQKVVNMKEDLEKIKEQVQNIL